MLFPTAGRSLGRHDRATSLTATATRAGRRFRLSAVFCPSERWHLALTIERECMSSEEALRMRVCPTRILLFFTVLAVAVRGCASCHHDAPAIGTASSFGACDSCASAADLPRGRLAPTPTVPLTPGITPGVTAPPGGTLPGPQVRLLVPETPPGQEARPLPRVGERARQPTQPSTEEPPALNADVPGFTVVKSQLATGQKPFADGLNWLKEKGYRTVLHVRTPGEDDSAARRQFEAKGFRYQSLEVS